VVDERVEHREQEHQPVLVQGEQHHHHEEGEMCLGDAARHVHTHRGRGQEPEGAGERAHPLSHVGADGEPARHDHGAHVHGRVPEGVALQRRVGGDDHRGRQQQLRQGAVASLPLVRGQLSTLGQLALERLGEPLVCRQVDSEGIDVCAALLEPRYSETARPAMKPSDAAI
jgi:hypothetical protein